MEDKASVNEMSRNEYQMIKRDIREAMRNAMQGWQLILELACFKVEEDTVRNLLFELSQSYFFKDQDPLLVLDCILDLEKDAEQMKIGMPLQDEIRRIATKSVRDAQEASESDIDSNLLQLLFDTPTRQGRLRYFIIENFITLRSAATVEGGEGGGEEDGGKGEQEDKGDEKVKEEQERQDGKEDAWKDYEENRKRREGEAGEGEGGEEKQGKEKDEKEDKDIQG
eukprot:Skav227869  [mRNA]  locus=scaffold2896:29109:35143:+ [translate_table: standard]